MGKVSFNGARERRINNLLDNPAVVIDLSSFPWSARVSKTGILPGEITWIRMKRFSLLLNFNEDIKIVTFTNICSQVVVESPRMVTRDREGPE